MPYIKFDKKKNVKLTKNILDMTVGQISDKKLMKLSEQTRVQSTLHIEAILKIRKKNQN